MSSIKQNLSFTFTLVCFAFVLPFNTAAPVSTRDDPFDKFVDFLTGNNCSLPKEVDIPFPVTNSAPFSYLSTPLKECQSPEALKENKAHLLCKEVFDVLQNITCNRYYLLPKINSSRLSSDICKDFAAIQDILPEQHEYLSRKLGDDIICKVLCTEKYELLCKTLLWSYDTQDKIKKALDSKVKEKEKDSVNYIIPTSDDLNGEFSAVQVETGLENHKEVNKTSEKTKFVPDLENNKKSPNGSSLSNFELTQPFPKSSLPDKAVLNKNISSLNSNNDGKPMNSNNISQTAHSLVSSKTDTQSNIKKISQNNMQPLNENVQPGEQNSELLDKNTDQEENGIDKHSKNVNAENPVSDANANIKVNSLTPDNTVSQNEGSNTSLPDNGNNENKANSNMKIEPNEEDISPNIPETEIDKDMNNVGLQEPAENETKYKEKQTDLKKKEDSKEGLISDGTSLETDSNLLTSTSFSVYSDKNENLEQHPEVKDPELYNDSENDGDYAKQEYEGFSPSLKKDSDTKNSIEDGSSQISSSSSIQISPENFPGQGLDVSRSYLPARKYSPEQEDSHFFFYFLSIVLILMAGYLIFHNKQKIIALIVEGRHERRRRSHGAGYKKLETK